MQFKMRFITVTTLIFVPVLLMGKVEFREQEDGGEKVLQLSNNKLKYSVVIKEGKLERDKLEIRSKWSSRSGIQKGELQTNADFKMDVMWTGWHAPGKVSNASNPVYFSKEDFRLECKEIQEVDNGSKKLNLYFKSDIVPFELKIIYKLEPEAFYIRRKMAIRDTTFGLHFLRKIYPCWGEIYGDISIVKKGGFGQPVAFENRGVGGFIGLEYPTSQNSLKELPERGTILNCGQFIGEKIGKRWVESEWVVEALTPNKWIKDWFFKYVNDIRIAPLRPYTLYNSWYDLRAPEVVKDSTYIMNGKNVMRIIRGFQNMIEKYNIQLDAFVLDDGWDVYKSDWELSKKQFPNGLKPIADELKKTNTTLGIWFGPIGGYSHRAWRVEWMRKHGYEVVGDQMCVAGGKYSRLFKKRVLDFIKEVGVGRFKWDGIQFSCSEPGHGHPIGIYSRRAAMASVIDWCQSAREENPDISLNITSGTWLSPWWLKYANQIWMQGGDYGYANVPSISQRDQAITYRDFVLYNDFQKNKFWFPMANLMTVGVIKGHLQKLGGEEEPLDKFTDNTLMCWARGVSMYELYTSPDLLTGEELNALAKSLHWARDRFPILMHTRMIGGNPDEGEPYGYVHFHKNKGIIAVRNPFIEPANLKVNLGTYETFTPDAKPLIVEQVYPYRRILPNFYSAKENVSISLQGYETAIYEVYPLKETSTPLLAGVRFEVVKKKGNRYHLRIYPGVRKPKLLNPKDVKSVEYEGKRVEVDGLSIPAKRLSKPIRDYSVEEEVSEERKRSEIKVDFKVEDSVEKGILALLFTLSKDLDGEGKLPRIIVELDGKEVKPKVLEKKGVWGWYKVRVKPGEHTARFQLVPREKKGELKWIGGSGRASVWFISNQKQPSKKVIFTTSGELEEKPMPPYPRKPALLCEKTKLGEIEVKLKK